MRAVHDFSIVCILQTDCMIFNFDLISIPSVNVDDLSKVEKTRQKQNN